MRDLYFIGDVHGDWKTAVWKLGESLGVRNADVVFLGDFGVGFGRSCSKLNCVKDIYRQLRKRLDKFDINLFIIRGNHDDPDYFTGEFFNNPLIPRLNFVKDFEVFTAGNKTIFPIGGAISIDAGWRVEYNRNQIKVGSSKRAWWPGEDINRESALPAVSVDVIACHESPTGFEPYGVVNQCEDLTSEIIKGRDYLRTAFDTIRPKLLIHGHYHKYSREYSDNGGVVMGLGILEIWTGEI